MTINQEPNQVILLSDWEGTANTLSIALIYKQIKAKNPDLKIILVTSSNHFYGVGLGLVCSLYPEDSVGQEPEEEFDCSISDHPKEKVFEPQGFFNGFYQPLFASQDHANVFIKDMPKDNFKSNPLSYLCIARFLSTNPANIILIDDNLHNRIEAEKSGIISFNPEKITFDILKDIIDQKQDTLQAYDENKLNEQIDAQNYRHQLIRQAIENKKDTTKPPSGILEWVKRKLYL